MKFNRPYQLIYEKILEEGFKNDKKYNIPNYGLLIICL